MAKQSETAMATRQAFIDTFCAIYKDKPVEKISVQELARKAGYNRSTFYEYYTDVYDLLEKIEDKMIAQIGEKIITATEHGNIAGQFIASFINMQNEFGAFVAVLLNNESSSKFAGRLKNAMLPIIMEQFHISEHDVKSLYVLEFYLSGVISITSRWMKSDRDTSVEELGGIIRSLLTEGILSALTKA